MNVSELGWKLWHSGTVLRRSSRVRFLLNRNYLSYAQIKKDLPKNSISPRFISGGAGRSRTDLLGFAIRCITALLPRRERRKRRRIEKGKADFAFPLVSGAGEESRTLDLYLGKVSLYQLSYSRRTERDYTHRLQAVNAVTYFWHR